jgi:hypothetical protein
MARALVVLALASFGAACAGTSAAPTESNDLRAYALDPSARRAALEASLVNRANGYATRRLAKYTESDWGALPEWNPRTRPLVAADRARPPAPSNDWASLDVEGDWTDASLRKLGERAFFEYPVQLAPYVRAALESGRPEELGLWTKGDRIGGVVWTQLPGGSTETALTCSTCHASSEDGRLVVGKNNAALRMDLLIAATGGDSPTWGAGLVDVTDDGVHNPTSIPDLRPVRFQRHLQRAGTVRNGLVPLAVRTETLIITSMHESVRPPRRVTAAMATFLFGLGEGARARPAFDRGADVFAKECGRCHAGEGASGDPVAIAEVGTDAAVGASPERGTGAYRVPSLRFVGDRKRLLANGAVDDVAGLLDPAREARGHRYGTALGDEDRRALRAYLNAL